MKKILTTIFLNIILLFSFSIPVFNMGADFVKASAETSSPDPYTSDVMQDLFAIDDFKKKFENGYYLSDSSTDSFDVIQTLEWGAGDCIDNKRTYYYVYLYVWNKSGAGFSYYNFEKARISTYLESLGTYEHVNLSYCSKSADNKFIKYRFRAEDKTYFSDTTNYIRHYPVYELEIAHFNNELSVYKPYSICHEWIYSGVGGNLVVTYHSECEHLELDVHGGTYMTESSNESISAKNVLYYSWFNVPSKFNGENYSLYSVHADYYRFDFSNKIGALIDEHDSNFYKPMNEQTARSYCDFSYSSSGSTGNFIAHSIFDNRYEGYSNAYSSDQHKYSFYVHDGSINYAGQHWSKMSNLYNDDENDIFFLPIEEYNSSLKGSYVASYFDAESAEALTGTNKNSVYRNIYYTNDTEPLNDAEFKQWDLLSYGANHNGWNNFWVHLLNGTNVSEYNIYNIPCIALVNPNDSSKSDENYRIKYLLDEEDIENVKNDADYASNHDMNTYIFRFDTATYDSRWINYFMDGYMNASYTPALSSCVGYLASSYIGIVDFDIIDLTFVNKAQRLLQLPVIADPINIFPTLVSPPEATFSFNTPDWWNNLMKILRIVLIVIIALILLWLILKIIGWFRKAFSKN